MLNCNETIKILLKELSFCLKLRFSNSYNLGTRFPTPLIFQTFNSGRSKSLSLKYQRFTPSGCKDIGDRKFKFVAKTQFQIDVEILSLTIGSCFSNFRFNPRTKFMDPLWRWIVFSSWLNNKIFIISLMYSELKTLEWWTSRLMLKLLVLLNPRLI